MLACQCCSLHTVSSSPDLNTTAVATLSLLTAGHRSSRVVLGDGTYPLPARPDQRALPFSPKHRWRGRASHPFFLAAVV